MNFNNSKHKFVTHTYILTIESKIYIHVFLYGYLNQIRDEVMKFRMLETKTETKVLKPCIKPRILQNKKSNN